MKISDPTWAQVFQGDVDYIIGTMVQGWLEVEEQRTFANWFWWRRKEHRPDWVRERRTNQPDVG